MKMSLGSGLIHTLTHVFQMDCEVDDLDNHKISIHDAVNTHI